MSLADVHPGAGVGDGRQNGVTTPQEMPARWRFRGRGGWLAGRFAGGPLPVAWRAPVVAAWLARLFFIVSRSHLGDFSVDKTPLLF